jgi:hypothetical protein
MFNNNGQLNIFEDFVFDRELPKFQKPRKEDFSSDDMADSIEFSGTIVATAQDSFIVQNSRDFFQLTWLQQLFIRFFSWISPKDKQLQWRPLTVPKGPPEITIHEFFSSIKNKQKDLEIVHGRAIGYECALEQARKAGQKALVEQLMIGLDATRSETQLHTLGLTTVLTEAILVEFVKKSPKGLRLDWIKNFTRVVPDEVLEAKLKCDERNIFDNYVVLHYDPDKKSWAETEAEKRDRQDPVLFGVIKGRRLLYFVGEWIDEFCDLSLDEIAEVLSKETAIEKLDPQHFS